MSLIRQVIVQDATDSAKKAAVIQNVDDDSNLNDEYGVVTSSGLYARLDSSDKMKPIRMDASTHSLQVLDYSHHEIHSGSHFYICNHATFSNAEVVDFTLVTPNTTTWTHMTFTLEGSGALSLDIKEGATVDTPGTSVTAYNNNRNSSNTTSLTIRTGDSFTGEGTLIFSSYSGANRVSGVIIRSNELVLKQNTTYIFRITNETALNNEINYCAEWYEHADKD